MRAATSRWLAGSWIPTWRRPVGGWAAQQCLEKTLKAWLHILAIKPLAHDLARLLLLLEQAGVDVSDLMLLRAFTTFAVQFRYDEEPEELGLNRFDWCNRADALIELVQS